VHVRRLQQIIRAFHYEDAILTVGLNEDRCYPAGDSLDLLYMSGVDPKLLEVLNRCRTEQIVAHLGNHENVSAAEPGGHRLICPLASKTEIELLAKNCFSGLRETIAKGSQVNICTSNHRNSRTFRHRIAESSQRSRRLSTRAIHHRVTETQRTISLGFLLCDSVSLW